MCSALVQRIRCTLCPTRYRAVARQVHRELAPTLGNTQLNDMFTRAHAYNSTATNPLSHPQLLDATVLRALKECASQKADPPCQAKVLATFAAAAQSGSAEVKNKIKAAGLQAIGEQVLAAEDARVNKAASALLAALKSDGAPTSIDAFPPVDEDLEQRPSLTTPIIGGTAQAQDRARHLHDHGHDAQPGGSREMLNVVLVRNREINALQLLFWQASCGLVKSVAPSRRYFLVSTLH